MKEDMEPDQMLRLTVNYSGVLGDDMDGFYRSYFKHVDGTRQYLAATQFESTAARKAFPCFDEPNRKATFSVTLSGIPEDDVALSNMPVVMDSVNDDGKRTVVFQKSVKILG